MTLVIPIHEQIINVKENMVSYTNYAIESIV
jgi:hypothetical protein